MTGYNIFEDLELDNPEDCLQKSHIEREILREAKRLGLADRKIAKRLGLSNAEMHDWLEGFLIGDEKYPLERWHGWARAFDLDPDEIKEAYANRENLND